MYERVASHQFSVLNGKNISQMQAVIPSESRGIPERNQKRILRVLSTSLRFAQDDTAVVKNRACIRIAALLRERVLRLAFDCKSPRVAEFTLR
jgi:hypothetical protein